MKKQFTIAAAVIASATLYGQNLPEGPQTFQFAVASSPAPRSFTYTTIGSPVVTGRPYSATEERKSSQTLGDGTHIETSETSRLFRDEQGRTRVERKDGTISIYDPVAGFSAELNPSTKTATKMIVMVRATAASPEAKAKLDTLKTQLAEREKQYSTAPPPPALKAQIADLDAALEKMTAEQRVLTEIRTDTVSGDLAPRTAEAGQMDVMTTTTGPGARGASGAVFAYSTASGEGPTILKVNAGANGSVESLPAQMINGVLSQGTRTTETIPVGKIGNDRVIHIVSERWFSNDLQMLIRSTNSDPRFGNSTYELTGILQTSPDPSLFTIPGDYTIRK